MRSNTWTVVGIHIEIVRNVCLVSSSDVDGAVVCSDCRERSYSSRSEVGHGRNLTCDGL
jgi:hypothetical protein